jgi:hypothetical protein
VVQVKVITNDRAPVRNALVAWCGERDADLIEDDTAARTDEHGLARVHTSHAKGRGLIAAAKEGFSSAGHIWRDGDHEVTLVLESGHEFEVRLKDTSGRPIPGVRLGMEQLASGAKLFADSTKLPAPTKYALCRAITDEQGIGVFRAIPPGKYAVGFDHEFFVLHECPEDDRFDIPHDPVEFVLEPLVGVLARFQEGRVLGIDAEFLGEPVYGYPRWQGQMHWAIHNAKIRRILPECFLSMGTLTRGFLHTFTENSHAMKIAALVEGAGWMVGEVPIRIIRPEDLENPPTFDLQSVGGSVPITLSLRTPAGHVIRTGEIHLITSSPISERDAWLTLPLGKRIGLATGTYRLRPRHLPVGLSNEDQSFQVDAAQPDLELSLAGECRPVEVRWTRPFSSELDFMCIRSSGSGIVQRSMYHRTGGREWVWVGEGNVALTLEGGINLRPIELEYEDGLTMPPVVECNFEWRQ